MYPFDASRLDSIVSRMSDSRLLHWKVQHSTTIDTGLLADGSIPTEVEKERATRELEAVRQEIHRRA